MIRIIISLCGIVGVLLLAACSNGAERVSEVIDRRILAIQVDPPEITPTSVLPSGNVTVTALVVEPGMPATTLNYAWGYCFVSPTAAPNPAGGGGFGGEAPAARCSDNKLLGNVNSSTGSLQLPLSYSVPVTLPNVSVMPSPQVRVQLQVDSTQGALYGVKNLSVLSTSEIGNANPVFDSISFDTDKQTTSPNMSVISWPTFSSPIINFDVCSADKRKTYIDKSGKKLSACTHTVFPEIASKLPETYNKYNNLIGQFEPVKERYQFYWYSDEGSWESQTTQQPDPRSGRPPDEGVGTVWREPPTKPTRPVNLWMVVSDGRGGITWETITITFN